MRFKTLPNPAVDGKEGEIEVRQLSSWKTSVPAGRWNAFAVGSRDKKVVGVDEIQHDDTQKKRS